MILMVSTVVMVSSAGGCGKAQDSSSSSTEVATESNIEAESNIETETMDLEYEQSVIDSITPIEYMISIEYSGEIEYTEEQEEMFNSTIFKNTLYWDKLEMFPMYKVLAVEKVNDYIKEGYSEEESCEKAYRFVVEQAKEDISKLVNNKEQ